eukprot:TRINITY_DN1157_c0_g1_i2.p2 TRINITY_DN1157_c0_g1~~TRINITY_DN1157_c0_g1_i2.p2  ORF type:complete len:175 (-),score=16.79 TRINITY_DN1157_c0_g1_i2:712-1236(-)
MQYSELDEEERGSFPSMTKGSDQYLESSAEPTPEPHTSIIHREEKYAYVANGQISLLPLFPKENIAKDPIERVYKRTCKKFLFSLTDGNNQFTLLKAQDEEDCVFFRCPLCNYSGASFTQNTLGPITYLLFLGVFFLFFPINLLFVFPLFMKRTQYIQHYCPNCQTKIGVKNPF